MSWSLSRAIGYRNQMLTATLVPSADSNRSKSGKYEADGCGLWRYLHRTGIRRDGDDDEKNESSSEVKIFTSDRVATLETADARMHVARNPPTTARRAIT